MEPRDGLQLGVAAAHRLADLAVTIIAPGLSDAELSEVQDRFDISFGDDHRAFLAAGLPVGERWPDWRDGNADHLAQLLSRPVDGVLFDVVENDFWHGGWGLRPDDVDEAVALAGQELAGVQKLIPVYGHRYLPEGRGTFGQPVLSVMQTDVIVYGADLDDYVGREFAEHPQPVSTYREPPAFWVDLAS